MAMKKAFMEEFFMRHYAAIRRKVSWVCAARGGGSFDCHDVDEIVQQVCEKLLLLGEVRLSAVENEDAYIFRVVERSFIDNGKRRTRQESRVENITSENLVDLLPDQVAGERIDEGELAAAIEEILAGMSAMNGTIGRMYFLDDRSEPEIARRINRAQSTVSGHVADIRRCLCEGLRKRFPEEVKDLLGGG